MKTLILLFCAAPLFATLPNGVIWELRTGGSDANGGGFVSGASGTDRSQSNSAFCTATDLVLVTNATATSATCPFSSASVGNIINVTAGTNFTVQRCSVASVATVTATLTCEGANAGTSGATGGSFALGGGLLTHQKAVTLMANTSFHYVYVKSGTYTQTTSVVYPNSIIGATLEGYATTHGDLGTAPLMTTATNSTPLVDMATSNAAPQVTYRNISFSNTAGTRSFGFSANTNQGTQELVLDRCTLDGFSVAVWGGFSTQHDFSALYVIKTEIKNSTGNAITQAGATFLNGAYIHDNTGHGLAMVGGDNQSDCSVTNSIFSTNGSSGIDINSTDGGHYGGCIIQNNIFYNQVQDGIRINGTNSSIVISNIFDSNGTGHGANAYGYDFQNGNGSANTFGYGNAYRNNFGGATRCVGPPAALGCETGAITLTASPFVSAGTNFALNSTAGGGTALKAAGYLGVIGGNVGTGFADIGPLQSTAAGGGGGNSAYAQ